MRETNTQMGEAHPIELGSRGLARECYLAPKFKERAKRTLVPVTWELSQEAEKVEM